MTRKIKRRVKSNWPYTYNYDDKKFLQFFRTKTGIQVGTELKRKLSRFLLTSPDADQWLRTSKDYRFVKSKKTVPFGEQRENAIRWHTILRDNLQKHWELYQKEKRPIRKIRRR